MLKSQEMRKLAPEMDPLRIGTGWKKEDLEKPQIMVESTYGDSHPGSGHLNLLVEEVRKGVAEAGGFGARYFCTDICDGESQGTDGINYSLASREMIANMIEIHANATPFDGGVYLSSCDKGMPGNLIGLARVDIPAVVVPGGTMNAGPEMLTLEQLGMYSAKFERGEIDEEKLDWAKCNACPSCGACSFIGTASTMQIMAEAARIICLGPAAKKQQKERPGRRIRRTEARIYQYLCLWGIDAGLGWETAATDAELARRFPAVEPGEYTRVCHLIEKHIYGEILLSPYEERTLNHFLEKLTEPVPGCSWKMRLKLRYACLRRVNTKKKKRKHSAFQQK